MPGVIGASIFSPRPARGYRFHSLQVEIILVPSQPRRPQSFSSNYPVLTHRFVLQSDCLTEKIASGNQHPIRISRISREVTDNATQFTVNYGGCCSSVSP